jgi:phage protein D
MRPFQIAPDAAPGGPVRTPVWRLGIAGKDVTREVSPFVLSVTYTDHAYGQSDDVQITVEDRDGLWRGPWLPDRGSTLTLQLGYEGGTLMDCGRFQVDEVEASGPPDVVSIRALAAGPLPALRTRRNKAYEGQTLAQVCGAVADRHGMTLLAPPGGAAVDRITQQDESDLAFLDRLAAENGYAFSIRGEQLVFLTIDELERAGPKLDLERTECRGFRMKTTTHEVYRQCEATYQHPATKRTIRKTVDAPGVETGDVLKVRIRVDSEAEAEARARAALRRANAGANPASVTVEGDPRLVAGINVKLNGWGAFFDGVYHVASSVHRLSRGEGYVTEPELRKVP